MGPVSRAVDHHLSKRPYMKNEPCADLGYFQENKDSLFFAIADVAGHGDNAHRLSLKIKKYFKDTQKNDLVALMKNLHGYLKGTRGAVGGAGFLYKKTGVVEYVGLGNISLRKMGKKDVRTLSNEGIIGYIIPTPRIKRLQLSAGETLLLYTDGIKDHFHMDELPEGLLDKDAKHIAGGVMKRFYKGNDDAACISIRYKND